MSKGLVTIVTPLPGTQAGQVGPTAGCHPGCGWPWRPGMTLLEAVGLITDHSIQVRLTIQRGSEQLK